VESADLQLRDTRCAELSYQRDSNLKARLAPKPENGGVSRASGGSGAPRVETTEAAQRPV